MKSMQAADEQIAGGTARERGRRSYLRQEEELHQSSSGLEEEAQGGSGELECEELQQVREGGGSGGRGGARRVRKEKSL